MTLTRLVIVLVPAVVVAAGNYAVAARAGIEATCPSCMAWLVGAPFLLAALAALLLARVSQAPVTTQSAAPAPPPVADDSAALRLLGALQEEGRLVDFLEEDLSAYGDAQIGAAARGIHEGCRKALRARVTLQPVMSAAEGDTVTVEAGFDPAAIRLTGNVSAAPPFRGVLRHPGWRVMSAAVPVRAGHDPNLIAPAEVEIP
jgi:hypothetical protein